MDNCKEKTIAPEIEKNIAELKVQAEREKEEKLVNLIIDIIVSSTLREYYEASDTIPKVQPDWAK